jgi:hypothetical protein
MLDVTGNFLVYVMGQASQIVIDRINVFPSLLSWYLLNDATYTSQPVPQLVTKDHAHQ